MCIRDSVNTDDNTDAHADADVPSSDVRFCFERGNDVSFFNFERTFLASSNLSFLLQDLQANEVCMLRPTEIEEILYEDKLVCKHEEYESCFDSHKTVLRKSTVII